MDLLTSTNLTKSLVSLTIVFNLKDGRTRYRPCKFFRNLNEEEILFTVNIAISFQFSVFQWFD